MGRGAEDHFGTILEDVYNPFNEKHGKHLKNVFPFLPRGNCSYPARDGEGAGDHFSNTLYIYNITSIHFLQDLLFM